MGLLKLGSKLKSKASFGSGAFGLAEDLKGLFREKSQSAPGRKDATASHAREQFYHDAELNSRPAFAADKSYYQKHTPDPEDDTTNEGFGTALHSAAAEGDTKEVQKLLLDGAPVDGEDTDGCTALHHAAGAAQLWVCEILLQNGASVNAEDLEGNTPLQRCAGWIGREPELDIISLLVQNGAEIDRRNTAGWTVIHEAAVNGQAQVIEQLAALGASIFDLTKEGDTALHKAARWGHADVVQLLLALGADVNTTDNMGRQPIDRTNDESIIAMLLAHHDTNPQSRQQYQQQRQQQYEQQYQQQQYREQQYRQQQEEQYDDSDAEDQPEFIPAARPASQPAHVRMQSIVADQWESYERRWTLFSSGADGAAQVSLRDVPFPVPPGDASTSLTDIVLYGAKDAESKRKRLRSELLRWHPDKFMGKFGSRLREADREAIMAQVKDIAQQLHSATKAYSS